MALQAKPSVRPTRRAVAARAAVLLLASAAAAAAVASPVFDHGLLWRVSRPGVADSYVFGTIHVADDRVSGIPPPVAQALERARTLATELVPVPLAADEADDLEALDGGAGLEALVGRAAYAQLRDDLLRDGVDEPAIARLKPWAALLRITRQVRAAEERSLDENLLAAARARRMAILPLEGADEQAASFDAVPLDTQLALLAHALARRDLPYVESEAAIAHWLRGDLGALARLPAQAGRRFPHLRVHYERLVRHIVHDRTAVLHHRLFLPLRRGRVFAAIGATHLPGDLGLLAMLRRDGYRVTRVW